ncbi:MAG: rhodanese-like domain-containing protein [Rhodospirillales bacterium]|nr:rhodanese-like domain-containing protein [Rhodospirillales bacterium]
MGIQQAGLIELEPADVAALMHSGQAVLVDVREEEEHAAERIPGTVLLPMSELDVSAWPTFPGRTTVILCRGGIRSAAVGRKLLQAGHPVAIHLKGGLTAWKEAGLAVVP